MSTAVSAVAWPADRQIAEKLKGRAAARLLPAMTEMLQGANKITVNTEVQPVLKVPGPPSLSENRVTVVRRHF